MIDAGHIDVAVDFEVAFDFLQFPCVAAVCVVQKMEKEGSLFEV